MQEFSPYFQLGWQHMLGWQGYGPLLFVIVLCCSYNLMNWKKVGLVMLVFALGYGLSFNLGLLYHIHLNQALVTFLVPLTVLISAASNLFNKRQKRHQGKARYLLILLFGFIHGLAFVNYFKTLQVQPANLSEKLLAFNAGLLSGQVLLLMATLFTGFILVWVIKVKKWDWIFFLSSAIFGISLLMTAEHFPALLQ
eukprot:gene11159-12999_t